jgi:hypothetical protein
MAGAPNCDSLFSLAPGLHSACVRANQNLGYDSKGNKLTAPTPNSPGGSTFFGIPLPSSDWWRHFMFRAGEVIIGVAMVIVGIKAMATSGDTTKVIVQGARKVGSKL